MSPLRYWGITLVHWLGVSIALSLTLAPALPCTRILLSPGYIQCKSSLMFTREVVVWKTALGCPSLIDEDPAHMGNPSLPVLWPHLLALGHGTHLGPGGRLSTTRHYHIPTPPEEEEMETGSSSLLLSASWELTPEWLGVTAPEIDLWLKLQGAEDSMDHSNSSALRVSLPMIRFFTKPRDQLMCFLGSFVLFQCY